MPRMNVSVDATILWALRIAVGAGFGLLLFIANNINTTIQDLSPRLDRLETLVSQGIQRQVDSLQRQLDAQASQQYEQLRLVQQTADQTMTRELDRIWDAINQLRAIQSYSGEQQ